jgi:hypothetical protein
MNEFYLARQDRMEVSFTDRKTGATFKMPIVSTPTTAHYPRWSPDGRTLLLTLWYTETAERTYPVGFLKIDPAARKATVVETYNKEDVAEFLALSAEMQTASMPAYTWTPDGKGIASIYLTSEQGYGLRLRDTEGRILQSMHWVGRTAGLDWFSPSGDTLMTSGCERSFAACLWEADTGVRRGMVPSARGRSLIGWFDETHIIVGRKKGDTYVVEAVDLTGKPVRVLAELRSAEDGVTQVFFTRK